MGIHIRVSRLLRIETEESSYGVRYWKTEKTGFDYLRHAGDKEFWWHFMEQEHKTEYKYPDHQDFEDAFFRPIDFDALVNWIKTGGDVPDGNKPRLLNVLEQMRQDPQLYFSCSY